MTFLSAHTLCEPFALSHLASVASHELYGKNTLLDGLGGLLLPSLEYPLKIAAPAPLPKESLICEIECGGHSFHLILHHLPHHDELSKGQITETCKNAPQKIRCALMETLNAPLLDESEKICGNQIAVKSVHLAPYRFHKDDLTLEASHPFSLKIKDEDCPFFAHLLSHFSHAPALMPELYIEWRVILGNLFLSREELKSLALSDLLLFGAHDNIILYVDDDCGFNCRYEDGRLILNAPAETLPHGFLLEGEPLYVPCSSLKEGKDNFSYGGAFAKLRHGGMRLTTKNGLSLAYGSLVFFDGVHGMRLEHFVK